VVKKPLMIAGSLLLGSALTAASLHMPAAWAAARAALVELTLPSRPFNQSANGSAGYVSVGPGASGTLAVSSITLTNMGNTPHTIFVFAPVFSDGSVCGSTSVIGGAGPRFYVVVPASQTVHLTYPTPVVYPGVSGQSCIAFGGAPSVDITVNGFIS
jgi:hypothetical protein